MGGGAATAIGKHLGGVVFYWRPWFLSIGSDSSESSFPIPPPASLGALGNVWKILKGRSTTIPYRVIHVATDITFVGVRNGVFKCLCHRCYSPGYRCWGWSASHVVIWVIIFLSVMLFALVSQIGELATAHMSLLAAFVVGTLDQWQHHRHYLQSDRCGLWKRLCSRLTYVAQSVYFLDCIKLIGDDLLNRFACHGCAGHGFL